MPDTPSTSWLTRLFAGLAVAVLLAAVIYAIRGAHPASHKAALPTPPLATSGAQVLEPPTGEETLAERATRLAAVDSTEKTAWLDEIPALELGMLSPQQREVFLRHANSRRCSCGCGFTLAACRRYDSECDVSLPRITALRDSVAAGQIRGAQGLRERPLSVR